jgi:hypothetical protein
LVLSEIQVIATKGVLQVTAAGNNIPLKGPFMLPIVFPHPIKLEQQ